VWGCQRRAQALLGWAWLLCSSAFWCCAVLRCTVHGQAQLRERLCPVRNTTPVQEWWRADGGQPACRSVTHRHTLDTVVGGAAGLLSTLIQSCRTPHSGAGQG